MVANFSHFRGQTRKVNRENGKETFINPLLRHFCGNSKVMGYSRTQMCALKCLGKVKFCRKTSFFLHCSGKLDKFGMLFIPFHNETSLLIVRRNLAKYVIITQIMPYHVIAHELYHIGKQIRGIRQVRPSDSFESEHCSTAFQGEYLPI